MPNSWAVIHHTGLSVFSSICWLGSKVQNIQPVYQQYGQSHELAAKRGRVVSFFLGGGVGWQIYYFPAILKRRFVTWTLQGWTDGWSGIYRKGKKQFSGFLRRLKSFLWRNFRKLASCTQFAGPGLAPTAPTALFELTKEKENTPEAL